MSSAFAALYARDLRLALRRRVEALLPLMFFVVAISLFPLGVGPEPDRLREIAAGIVWVSALLAAMLSVSSLYAGDLADGSLEQMLLSGQPGALIAGAKAAAHWTVTGAPLVLAAPLIGLLLDMSLPWPACTWASSSRRPMRPRVIRTGSSSCTCLRPGCRWCCTS
jgi:heme exporter protein B